MEHNIAAPRSMSKFLIVWMGQMVSILGSGLTSFALGVWIYDQTGSVGLLAGNMLAWVLPNILLTPIAGVLADRMNRRLLMIAGDIGAGVSSLIVLILLLGGRLEIWHIYLTTIINSASSSFQWPAYAAAIPQMVPKEHLGRANGLVQAEEAFSYLAAPALAGVLYVNAHVGLVGIVLIDVGTFFVAILTLILIRIPSPPDRSQDGQQPTFWADLREGWQFISVQKGLIGLLGFYTFIEFLQEFTFPLIQPLLLEITTPSGMGSSLSIMSLGMVVGIAVMTFWGGPQKRIPLIVILSGVGGLMIIVAGLRPSIILITVSGFSFFALAPITEGLDLTFWQTKVPNHMQGRVFSMVATTTSAVRPLALILSGPLADGFFEPALLENGILAGSVGSVIGTGPGRGVALFIMVIGMLMAVASALALTYAPLREIESVLPDVDDDEVED